MTGMVPQTNKQRNAPRSCRIRWQDGELIGLSVNCVAVVGILDEIDTEMGSSGPTSRRGVHISISRPPVNQGGEDLKRKSDDALYFRNDIFSTGAG